MLLPLHAVLCTHLYLIHAVLFCLHRAGTVYAYVHYTALCQCPSLLFVVQAQLASRKGRQAAKSTAASETTAAAAAETPVALERTHSGSTTESDVPEADAIELKAVSGVPVFDSALAEGEQLLSAAVSGDSGHQSTSADKPNSGACADAAVISCSCESESSRELQTAGLALTPDSAAVGKDGQPDPLFARKAGNAVERRHASDRACSKVRGQAGEQEGADGSSKASVQRERKKNAPVDICDHGLEAVAMPPAKEGECLLLLSTLWP